jgi:hypothetical protein
MVLACTALHREVRPPRRAYRMQSQLPYAIDGDMPQQVQVVLPHGTEPPGARYVPFHALLTTTDHGRPDMGSASNHGSGIPD